MLLEVDVGRDGAPRAVRVRESSGHSILDESAVETVEGWLFKPGTQDGQPVDSKLMLSIVYKLHDN